MALSTYDYVEFSKSAYSNNIKENDIVNSWTVIKTNKGINGFQAVAYGKDIDGDGKYDEVVIAYRGTDSATDIFFDDLIGIVGGIIPGQYTGALNFYNDIIKLDNISKSASVNLTGHSLGGGLAQLVGAKNGLEAITFNAPGMEYALSKIDCNQTTSYDYIKNYIVMNDYVGNFREHIGQEYYYEPIPIIDEPLLDTHNGILELGYNSNDYFTLPETFGTEEGLSLWYYDTRNNITSGSQIGASLSSLASIDSLENAINIIRTEIGAPKNYLSYSTDNGMYILDSKDGSHVIIGKDSSNNGNDIIFANNGSDIVNGYAGDDILVGGDGGDTLYGGEGDDVLIAGNTDNITIDILKKLKENKSQITSIEQYESSTEETNNLYGGEGDDLLIGDMGKDYLYGGDGNDYIYGGQDDDLLDGGKGNDKLYGGEGNDTYSFTENDGNDTIIDSDGQGKILADGIQLFGSAQDPISDNVWKDNDGNMYFWSGTDETNLLIQTACNNNITVENFKNGDLNINLKIPQNHPKNPKKHEKYFANAEQERNILQDPIIVDLNRDYNYETTDIQHGIYFDHDNDGFAEASAWVGKNDGILFIDNNQNNCLDNGSELLSADNLSQFDTDNNGIIDKDDADFNKLRVLKGDGTLLTMQEAEIRSLNTSPYNINVVDENGNRVFKQGSSIRTDGTIGSYGIYMFQVDTTDSKEVKVA